MNLFIEGYGSSTITKGLCWLLIKFKGFKKLHVEPATEYPTLLAASKERPNRDEAMGSFVIADKIFPALSTKEGLQCPAMF